MLGLQRSVRQGALRFGQDRSLFLEKGGFAPRDDHVGPAHVLEQGLAVHAQGGRGLGAQPRLADLLAAFLADAVFPVLDPVQGLVDLADELAVALDRKSVV